MKHVFIINIYGNYDYVEKYRLIQEICIEKVLTT